MQMLRSKCARCEWVHDVVTLPMPVPDACGVMGASHCPMCGNGAGNTMAAPRALTPDEVVAKGRAITCSLPAERAS